MRRAEMEGYPIAKATAHHLEPPSKSNQKFLAAAAPEAVTEARTAPTITVGAYMARLITRAAIVSIIIVVNPDAAVPVSAAVVVLHSTFVIVVAHLFSPASIGVIVHSFTAAALMATSTAAATSTPAAIAIVLGGYCRDADRKTCGQREQAN
jgi:hypothetical protein